MDLNSFAQAVHSSALAEWMRSSLKAMPVVESIHVFCVALIFGTILIIDLRMLGYPDTKRSWTRTYSELVKVAWGAFAVSVVTGVMMFAPNAITYVGNTAFRLKLLTLLVIGINMAIFHLVMARNVSTWDKDARAPLNVRLAGALSIVLWIAVIFLARWIGFTKGYDFAVPQDVQFDFSK
jgi:hypothetical protein